MAEDNRQPDTDASKPADVSAPSQPAASSDTEKNAQVEDAKARVTAARAKAAAAGAGAAAPPKPPVKKKDEGPKPTDASGHPLVGKLRASLNGGVLEAFEFLGQVSIRIAPADVV